MQYKMYDTVEYRGMTCYIANPDAHGYIVLEVPQNNGGYGWKRQQADYLVPDCYKETTGLFWTTDERNVTLINSPAEEMYPIFN